MIFSVAVMLMWWWYCGLPAMEKPQQQPEMVPISVTQFPILATVRELQISTWKKKNLKPQVVCATRRFDTRKQKDSSCIMLCQSLMTQSLFFSSPSHEVSALRAGDVEFPSSRRKPWARLWPPCRDTESKVFSWPCLTLPFPAKLRGKSLLPGLRKERP